MYARSTTMTAGEGQLEAGLRYLSDEVWPALNAMDGCMGLSVMVQRDTGRMIATSAWTSEDAMRHSESQVAGLRRGAEMTMSAEAPQVQEWEIAAMHRDHHTGPGTCVRAAWTRLPFEDLDRALDFWKFMLLPQMEAMQGFCSASLMIDRASGRGVTSVAFDSREAMEATRDDAARLREMSSQEIGVEFLEVAEFELVLAHLHVPELV